MKKLIRITIFSLAFVTLMFSCQKETSLKSASEINAVSNSAPDQSMADIVVTQDLTGFPVHNNCTGEDLIAISGTVIFNIAPDGFTIRSTVAHNFVLKDIEGNLYHASFVSTFELIGSTGFNNTYKLVLSPQGGDYHQVLQGELHIAVNPDGTIKLLIDKFFVQCP